MTAAEGREGRTRSSLPFAWHLSQLASPGQQMDLTQT